MTTRWIETLAAEFWDRAGPAEPLPRNLERAILTVTRVGIVKLPRLRLATVRQWLEQRRPGGFPLATQDRALKGCLITDRGTGFIFVDGSLAPGEARMVVAHEFGHYLAEYDRPRRRAARLAPSLLQVLDGDRRATPAEALGAALAGVELGTHVHFMDRTFDPRCIAMAAVVERTADLLAMELVAPWRAVLGELRAAGPLPADPASWRRVLSDRFGLPRRWAVAYTDRLMEQARRLRSFSETLGF